MTDRPAWRDALSALEGVLEVPSAARTGGIDLRFYLAFVADDVLEVTAWVARLGKSGKPGAPRRFGRGKLLLAHGEELLPEDARVVAAMPERDGPAPRALLEALVAHPRVVLHEDPTRAVRVERVALGLVAEDRNRTVRLTVGIEGASLPRDAIDRLRRTRPEGVPFFWDGDRLSLLDVAAELRPLLPMIARDDATFPPESHGELLPLLARLARHVPVAMPRSVLGRAVAPSFARVLRLTAHPGGALTVEVRVRAMVDGPTHVPGVGARDVHVRRGELALHAVRDLVREVNEAEALVTALSLDVGERYHAPFTFHFPHVDAAFAVLDAARRLASPPDLEWATQPLKLAGSARASELKVTVDRRRLWFGVLGELKVGSDRVELARLLDAVRREERHVEVAPFTYLEIGDVVREHLLRVADHAHVGSRGIEASPAAVAALVRLELDGAHLEADAALRRLAASRASAESMAIEVPESFRAVLRSYQREGVVWLMRLAAWGAGAVLADDMGLGKTMQALAVMVARSDLGPALVVAPTSVAFVWRDEAARFAPSLRIVLHGDPGGREALSTLGPGDVLVTSYGLLVREVERLAAITFGTIVFDEAQQLKNAATQRARAARTLVGGFKVALSGTPMENHLGELWSVFASVFPSLLGSWDVFRERHANPIEKALDPAAPAALGRVIAPFLLRRTKSAVASELPPRTEVRVPVVLSTAEWTLYEDARLAALSDLETRRSKMREQERRVEVLAALTRLRLCASHPRLYDERSEIASSKLRRFVDIVDELRAEGERVLVFSQFVSHLALARDALDERNVAHLYLDGSTSSRDREARVAEFQAGAAPVFLISLKAGGFGLNLTAASSVIHLDPWWNPAVEDQASDRAHRIGQTKPVTIYRLVSVGTIEDRMSIVHREKRALVDAVLSEKHGAAKLSVQDLVDLMGTAAPYEVREAAGTLERISSAVVGARRRVEAEPGDP